MPAIYAAITKKVQDKDIVTIKEVIYDLQNNAITNDTG